MFSFDDTLKLLEGCESLMYLLFLFFEGNNDPKVFRFKNNVNTHCMYLIVGPEYVLEYFKKYLTLHAIGSVDTTNNEMCPDFIQKSNFHHFILIVHYLTVSTER